MTQRCKGWSRRALSVVAVTVLVPLVLPRVSAAAAGGETDVEARARAIGKELRCVVCQNQSIDESTAPLALDLKQLLRERLAAGDTDQAAKQFLVTRYGNFVLLKPPFQPNTVLLWLGPFLLLAVAGLAVWRYLKTGQVVDVSAPQPAELTAEERRKLASLLEEGARQ